MSVSYNGLWKLLIDKNMQKMDWVNSEKICEGLDCDFGDIINYVKKQEDK